MQIINTVKSALLEDLSVEDIVDELISVGVISSEEDACDIVNSYDESLARLDSYEYNRCLHSYLLNATAKQNNTVELDFNSGNVINPRFEIPTLLKPYDFAI